MTTRREQFRKFAARVHANAGIDATNIRFIAEGANGGTWWVGKDADAQDFSGRRMLADTANVMEGYRKFSEGKIPIYAVVRVADGIQVPPREQLGDNDRAKWQLGKYNGGKPQDPWQWITLLPLIDEETGETFVHVTATSGGHDAVGALAEAYAARPDDETQLPLISLQSHSRLGSDGRRYHYPIFRIEGWKECPQAARRLAPPPLPLPPAPGPQGELGLNGHDRSAAATARADQAVAPDDDIPF